MRFTIESKRTVKFFTAFIDPKVTVFLDQVRVEFGNSGVIMKFDSVDEAMQVLNNIIRQLKGE